ncbi:MULTISPECIES: hypothetical protein [Clostridium]|uniref:Uncharacterized protein n=1 Tax=Clostridium ragsdalei P11 TaxID=1353534 RepID=A0A1A6AYH8_9CLOT|nr:MULTISPECIES: hypothetical protein [Clostridium]OBR95151.1 hypothetical protein CLRAG_09890 [Clostridium ragsdalei P11]QXE20686.1 hypothetical protein B5S50_18515 [Clostridium sp. 001]
MDNLWNLQDIDKKVSNSPNLILEEQARYFEKTIKGVLYAKIINTRLKSNDDVQEYKLATSFNIVSPELDNYTYTLFTVYSNPEANYPVAISVNNNEDYIDIDYTCNNETEFIRDLSKILSSDKVTDIIEVLYSKSKNF